MRRLFLALMIALLPLRGWVGDAMATQMATQMAAPLLAQQVVSNGGAAHVHAPMTSMHGHPQTLQADTVSSAVNCLGHAGSDNPSSSDLAHCESCVVCQACQTVALAFPVSVFADLFADPEPPQSVAARFTSAKRALGLKPPIS